MELALVLVVMALAAGLLLQPAGSADERRLEASAREVAAALRYARDEALRRGSYVGVNADPATHRVRLFVYDFAKSIPQEEYSVLHPVEKRLYDLKLDDGPVHRGVRIAYADYYSGGTLFQGSITFDPRGRPILVKNKFAYTYTSGAIQLTAGSAQRAVLIESETGRTSLQ